MKTNKQCKNCGASETKYRRGELVCSYCGSKATNKAPTNLHKNNDSVTITTIGNGAKNVAAGSSIVQIIK